MADLCSVTKDDVHCKNPATRRLVVRFIEPTHEHYNQLAEMFCCEDCADHFNEIAELKRMFELV